MMELSVDGEPLGDIERVQLCPGDVLVLTVPGRVTCEQAALWKDRLKAFFPNNDVAIVSDAAELTIVSPDQAPEGGSDGE